MKKPTKEAQAKVKERIVQEDHLHATKGGIVTNGGGGRADDPPPDPNGGG